MATLRIFEDVRDALPTFHQEFPVDKLPPSEEIERDKPDKNFVKSVERYGVRVPIAVQHLGSAYEIVYGRKRVLAARMAGMETVPAFVYDAGAPVPRELTYVENHSRSGNKATDLRLMMDMLAEGLDLQEIAGRLCESEAKIKRTIEFLSTREGGLLATEMLAGKMKPGVLQEIAKRPRRQRQILLNMLDSAGHLTHDDLDAARQMAQYEWQATAPSIFSGDASIPPYITSATSRGDRVSVSVLLDGVEKSLEIPISRVLELINE